MTTRLTGYNNTVTDDDTYELGCVDPMARKTTATITLTKLSAYDGTVTVEGRSKGSTQAYQTLNYAKPPGSAVASTAITPDAIIEVDATGKDIALVTSGRTVGQLQIDVAMSDQD